MVDFGVTVHRPTLALIFVKLELEGCRGPDDVQTRRRKIRSTFIHGAMRHCKLPPCGYLVNGDHQKNPCVVDLMNFRIRVCFIRINQKVGRRTFMTRNRSAFSLSMKNALATLLSLIIVGAEAFSSTLYTRSELIQNLQTCHTAEDLLEKVGQHLTQALDPDGSLASLVLVRMGKILMNKDNERREQELVDQFPILGETHQHAFFSVVKCLCSTNNLLDVESLVEGTKACASISRIVKCELANDMIHTMDDFWTCRSNDLLLDSKLEPHHLSGLFWSFETYDYIKSGCAGEILLPMNLKQAYDDLELPFRILPGFCSHIPELSVPALSSQVNFRVDSVRTSSQQLVKERRETAWEGDDGVEPFQYSGKSMPRDAFSPTVKRVRDLLNERLHQYFDCCLLNLYPDGKSAMRYHIDPDQGSLWDYDTVVVSVGASRRFGFRRVNADNEKPHTFVVMHGDVTHMFGDCQESFQHAVKKADIKTEKCSRASLVFKRSWDLKT